MNLVSKGPTALLFAVLSVGLGTLPAAWSSQYGQDRPVDRWLVAAPEVADTAAPEARLSADLLAAPGELGVLPDRGSEAAGVTWRLVRRDGASVVPLDSVFPDADAGAVVYAHSYLRLPEDRTLRLEWGGADCTRARAWLNGRPIPTGAVDARFGEGWNTLLIKLVAGDCPFGYHATLVPRASGPTDDVRVQASRPFGDIRTGPDDWIAAADTARIAADRRWRGDRLYAGLVIGLTAWGRGSVSGVELELRGVSGARATAPWLVPGVAEDVVVPVRLDRVDRLVAADQIDVRLRWADGDIDRPITIVGTPPGASERVALDGWKAVGPGHGESGGRAGLLPNAPGRTLEGEWRVPEALGGRALVLDAEGAPADYRLNGAPAPTVDGAVRLCSPCTKGVRLRISATSTAPWVSMPSARIADERGGG